MTVTSIPGVGVEVKRLSDSQNKQAEQQAQVKSAAAATPLPADSIEAFSTTSAGAGLGLQAATQETARQNREAAASTLSDADLEALANPQSAQETVLQQARAAQLAQTNRLPPSMLELLSE